MDQENIRDYNGQQYSIAEGAALIAELNARTESNVPALNSVDELARAMSGIASAGAIKLDRIAGRNYGTASGNLILDLVASVINGFATVDHLSDTAPTITTDFNIQKFGSYVPNLLNVISIYKKSNDTLGVTYAQPTVIAGTLDLTAPTFLSATVGNSNPDQVIAKFSEAVTALDVSGLAVTGFENRAVNSIVSGNGTDTLIFGLSAPLTAEQSYNFEINANNTINDDAGNAIDIVSVNIVNNVSGVTVFVDWTDEVNAVDEGNGHLRLPTDGSETTGWTNGAYAVRAINGDNSIKFKIGDVTRFGSIGLTNAHAGIANAFASINYWMDITDDTNPRVLIFENGTQVHQANGWNANDEFEIALNGSTVSFLVNGSTIFTSSQTPALPLNVVGLLIKTGNGSSRVIDTQFDTLNNLVLKTI